MVTVTVSHPSGVRDEAHAESAEGAVCAARTLFDEMCEAHPYQGFRKSITTIIRVEGRKGVFIIEGQRP